MSDYACMTTNGIRRDELDNNPIRQFQRWLAIVEKTELAYPNTMVVATVDADGMPSARAVLLKGVDDRGFVFFTNYSSKKAQDLGQTAVASLVFCWPSLGMQVRARGPVERVSAEESDAYFRSRPRISQIGAWASRQSCELRSRTELEDRQREVEKRFADRDIPRPDFWGGYRVMADIIEFWKGREGRLHDRFEYRRQDDGTWDIVRLSP